MTAIEPGCWVVVADPDLAAPLELATVVSGPEYEHADGHALGAIWTVHDGRRLPERQLELFDMAEVLEVAAGAIAGLRVMRWPADADMVRVDRAARMARRVASPTPEMAGPLVALTASAAAMWEFSEAASRAIRVRLPALAESLYWAGLIALASDLRSGWVPGDPDHPHPRWPEIPARRTR